MRCQYNGITNGSSTVNRETEYMIQSAGIVKGKRDRQYPEHLDYNYILKIKRSIGSTHTTEM